MMNNIQRRLPTTFTRAFTTTLRPQIAKLTLIGRLAGDPETITAASGVEYVRYTVGSFYFSKGESKASWFPVTSFDEYSRPFLQSLKKGTLVYVDAVATMEQPLGDDGKQKPVLRLVQRTINALSKPAEPASEPASESASAAEEEKIWRKFNTTFLWEIFKNQKKGKKKRLSSQTLCILQLNLFFFSLF